MTTKIQWTEETWNPIVGCSVVSPGCTNCYAMRRTAPRLSKNPATQQYHGTVQPSKGGYVWTGKIGIAGDTAFLKPLRTKKPTMFFVNSMSDLFHENVPDEVIDRIFAIMALCPQHTFQVLTKRSARMRGYLDEAIGRIADAVQPLRTDKLPVGPLPHVEPGAHWWPLPNVWLGVSVEDQTRADERIPDLLATPAAIRFISAEPLLGPLDLADLTIADDNPGDQHMSALYCEEPFEEVELEPWKDNTLDWVIVGGESGKGARPMHPDWARDIRDQCVAARVPFFFKQWGEHLSGDAEDHGDRIWFNAQHPRASRFIQNKDQFDWFDVDMAPDGPAWLKLGTKAAGRELDGREHNAMPEPPQP